MGAKAEGKEVRRTGVGHDFKERTVDFLTGKKRPWKFIEVKTGQSKLSPKQKGVKKKLGEKYEVVRDPGMGLANLSSSILQRPKKKATAKKKTPPRKNTIPKKKSTKSSGSFWDSLSLSPVSTKKTKKSKSSKSTKKRKSKSRRKSRPKKRSRSGGGSRSPPAYHNLHHGQPEALKV